MKPAYIYLPVSSVNQLDGFGFSRQEDTVRRYAKRNGYQIAKVFREEAVSGCTDETERPAFQQMMTEVLTNGIRTVIVEGLDRLAREYRIQETLVVYLASKGVSLISARTNENVTEAIEGDPLRKALVQIQGIFAELDKAQLVMRLRKGKEKARAEGKRVDGRRAYGEDSPQEQAVIRRIKLMRRTRRGGHRGMTYAQIADKLNADGVTTRSGKAWTAQSVHHICTKR